MNKEQLDKLLIAKEPEEKEKDTSEFKPRFNVREEFALWIREQFPNLEEYAKKREIYQALEDRKEEVYQAALGAVNHGVTSTDACANQRLYSGWSKFEKGFGENGNPEKRAKGLESFVKALEDLSLSLGGDDHYTEAGTFLSGGSYNRHRRGHLNAFVYRVGKEDSADAQYLVFDEKQEFENGNNSILIGELTRLTESDIKTFKKIAKRFKGPETEFIERVDMRVPEPGTHTYSSYGANYRSHRSYRSSGDNWLDRFLEARDRSPRSRGALFDNESNGESLFTSKGREARLSREISEANEQKYQEEGENDKK